MQKNNRREQLVVNVKEALREDIDQKKEIAILRKKDQEENYMRGQNFHNLYKQKLMEKIIEKKEKADRVKEQQKRIADVCNTNRTIDPFRNAQSATNKKAMLNMSSLF